MRVVSAGAVLSSELLSWELLINASECWGSRIKKSFWRSIPGTLMNDAMGYKQNQSVPNAVRYVNNSVTDSRVCNDTYSAFVLNVRERLSEAYENLRSIYGSVCAGMCKGAVANNAPSDSFSRGQSGELQRNLSLVKGIPLDAMSVNEDWPKNGLSAIELFKEMQQMFLETFSPFSSKNPDCYKVCTAFYTQGYQGLGKNVLGVWRDQAFTSDSKLVMARAHMSGSFGCLKRTHGHRHALPVALFERALSTSTEKQFEDDAGEQQASVPSQQQASVPSQQQSSLGGQQSSLEIPESKPVSGPSWPNPDNAASYVLMSNIYADGDRWDEVKRINEMRLKARAWKKPGKAYVEIQAKVHEFIVGDRTHQDSTNIYEKLRKIKRHMGHIGYVPYVDLVLENRSYYDPYAKPR